MIGIPGSFLSGFASAGATPPLSALKETMAPEARTATALRQEQVFKGARIWVSTPLVSSEGGGNRHRCLQPSPPTLDSDQQAPRCFLFGRGIDACGGAAIRFHLVDRCEYRSVTRRWRAGEWPMPGTVAM